MSLNAVIPLWFTAYPEFDAGTARVCVADVERLHSTVSAIRNQILESDSLLKQDGAGAWFEEYSRHLCHVCQWLEDAQLALARLAVSLDEAIDEAVRAGYVKDQAWFDVQRFVRPVDFGIDAPPISPAVALREYVFFRPHEHPVPVPHLDSPSIIGIAAKEVVRSLASMFSQGDTVAADTDLLRRASSLWEDMGWECRRSLGVFEEAAQAWTSKCGEFAPANFAPLLEALREFYLLLQKQARQLDAAAQRFDGMQEEVIELFNWSEPKQAYLAGVRTENLDPLGHGDEYRAAHYKEDERPWWLQMLGIPHTWRMAEWSDAEFFDAITIVFPLGWAVKPVKAGFIGVRNAPKIIKGFHRGIDAVKDGQKLKTQAKQTTSKTSNAQRAQRLKISPPKNKPSKMRHVKLKIILMMSSKLTEQKLAIKGILQKEAVKLADVNGIAKIQTLPRRNFWQIVKRGLRISIKQSRKI